MTSKVTYKYLMAVLFKLVFKFPYIYFLINKNFHIKITNDQPS